LTSDSPPKSLPRLKERLEAICKEMVDRGVPLSEAAGQFEKCFIAEVLSRNGGNLLRASAGLGLNRNTLAKRVALYNIKHRKT
jgi:DNA-binding NtrC family response regulator